MDAEDRRNPGRASSYIHSTAHMCMCMHMNMSMCMCMCM